MARIIQFPAPAPAPASLAAGAGATELPFGAALPCTGGRRCEYAVGDLARMLGIAHFSPRTVIDYLRAAARDRAMPLPKTPRWRAGQLVRGPQAIWRQSRWDAELFDGWHARGDGDCPVPPASAALRADLARRAAAIAITPRRIAGAAQ